VTGVVSVGPAGYDQLVGGVFGDGDTRAEDEAPAFTDLRDRVVIVTGAASGIGLRTAQMFGAAGANVVLADLPGSKLEEAAASIVGGAAVPHVVDIADETMVRELIRFTVDRFGRLDVVDNNAARLGLAADLDVVGMDVDLWDGVFAVNSRGTMLMCKHAVPVMIERGGGSIINVSSAVAFGGDDFATAYGCSKAAIVALTRYVATQYGQHGVRCNSIAPGLVHTPALDAGLPEPMREVFISQQLVGRLGEPSDIAAMVLFLASDRSSFITGQVIQVDGGFLAHLPNVDAGRRLLRSHAQSDRVG
jgi:NAD(P)-dependent dehydrogenase (short-subunit alcohol dehydrogenase family)